MEPGVLAVMGTLLGVAVGAGLEALRDQQRWRRQEATRWRAEKLGLYSTWMNAAREVERWGVVIAISSGLQDWVESGSEPKSHERRGWDRWMEAHEELRRLRGRLDLIAPPEVREAAAVVTDALEASMKTLIEQVANTPRAPGGDVSVRDVLLGLAPMPEQTEVGEDAKAALREAAETVGRAFERFRIVAQAEL